MPYVDKVKSVKKHGVSHPRWAIWREIWKWSCLPSLLYCISRKTVDTEYTYYSWCMTSTDIVKWKKNEWLWKFWKRNDLYENFEKRGVVEKRGEEERKSMPHAPVCKCRYNISRVQNIQDGCGRVREWLLLRGHNFISLWATKGHNLTWMSPWRRRRRPRVTSPWCSL